MEINQKGLNAMSDEFRKNEHHFYKTAGRGCNYSLMEDAGVTLFSAVISPDSEGDRSARVMSAIQRLDVLLRRERMEGSVVGQTVFLRDIGDKLLMRRLLLEYYGDNLPVITYVPQTPCEDDDLFLFEVLAMKGNTRRVKIIRQGEQSVTVDIAGVSFGFFGELTPEAETDADGAFAQSIGAFDRMRVVMKENGFAVSDLLRTWLYQGGIVRPEGATQRYKELNRARTDFFRGVRFLEDFIPRGKSGILYPASTGIGADGLNIKMSGIALLTEVSDAKKTADGTDAPKQKIVTVPLENPGQTPAFDYGKVYSPESPKFSRAMAVVTGESCNVFISGTASIVDSETKFVGDPAAQTRQTIENIRALISAENLARHGIDGFDAGLENLAAVRVYVKRKEDYSTIRTICEEIFGGTPIIFTLADVCRDDLLVEIEGLAACRSTK